MATQGEERPLGQASGILPALLTSSPPVTVRPPSQASTTKPTNQTSENIMRQHNGNNEDHFEADYGDSDTATINSTDAMAVLVGPPKEPSKLSFKIQPMSMHQPQRKQQL